MEQKADVDRTRPDYSSLKLTFLRHLSPILSVVVLSKVEKPATGIGWKRENYCTVQLIYPRNSPLSWYTLVIFHTSTAFASTEFLQTVSPRIRPVCEVRYFREKMNSIVVYNCLLHFKLFSLMRNLFIIFIFWQQIVLISKPSDT